MPKVLLRGYLSSIFLISVSVIAFTDVFSQGCSYPSSPPSGGPQFVDNGEFCANKMDPAVMAINAWNINDGNNRANFGVYIEWDDGTTQAIKWGDSSPDFSITYGLNAFGVNQYTVIVKHVYPVTGANVKCQYQPRTYLSIAMSRTQWCPAPFGTSPVFTRHNFDDQPSGTLLISETVSQEVIYYVCQGTSVNVTFTDRSTLNCVPPELEDDNLNNREKRWRQFVYGVAPAAGYNEITGIVNVGGTPVTVASPKLGVVNQSDEPIEAPFPPVGVTTESIMIPATALVGEEFVIRMNYWNKCNPYDDPAYTNAPRTTEARIRIIAQPPDPIAISNDVCIGANLSLAPLNNQFAINSVTRNRVFWRQDNAGVPGASLTNPNGNNSLTFPISAYPGGINPNVPGVYTLWVAYRRPGAGSTPACVSNYVPVTITIRQDIPTPGPFTTASNQVCNGSTGVVYQFAAAAGPLNPGGATEYEYEVTDNSNSVVNDVTLNFQGDGRTWLADFDIDDPTTFGSALSIQRKIRVRRKYSTNVSSPSPGTACPSNYYEYPITIFRQTDPGVVTGGDIKCKGEVLDKINWTPGVGTIVRWERSDDGGGTWVTQGSFGTSTNPDPTTLNLNSGVGVPATYLFRAQIQNGVCDLVATAQVSYTINPNADIALAGSNQNLCFNVGDPLVTALNGNAPTAPATGVWDLVSGPVGGTANFTDATVFNTNVLVNNPGKYTFRWKITNGTATCSTESTVIVSFGRDPGTPVPVPSTVCALTSTLTTTTPPTYEEPEWTVVSGPGSATIVDNLSSTTDVTVSAYGSYVFNIRYSSGSCPNPKDANVTMVFTQPVTAIPNADFMVCEDSPSINVSGTISGGAAPGVQTGRWALDPGNASGSFSSGGTSLAGPTIPGVYQPVAADVTRGHVIIQLIADDPDGALVGCPSTFATMRIDFDKKPAPASAAAIPPTCSDAVTLNASLPTNGGIGIWSISAGPGTLVDPTLRNSGVTDLLEGPAGTNVFTWTVTSAQGKCAPTTVDIDVIRDPGPAINLLSPNLCETNLNSGIQQGVNLASYEPAITGGANVTLKWYTSPSRTPASQIDPLVVRDVANGTIFYLREESNTGAGCATDGIINFVVNGLPFVANIFPTLCDEDVNDGQLLVTNVDLTDYDMEVSITTPATKPTRSVKWFPDNTLTPADEITSAVGSVLDGDIFYGRVENTLTGCYNVAEVSYIVSPIPVANPIVGPNTVCLDPDNVIFFKVTNLNANYTYKWTLPPASGVTNTTGIDTDFFVLLQFAAVVPGGIPISVVETSPEGCVGPTQEIIVEVEDSPNALTITGPDEVCEGDTNVQFDASNFSDPINYLWTVPPGASIVSGANTSTITVNFGSTPGDVTVVPSTIVGCTGSGFDHPVAINLKPILANLDKTICSKEISGLQLATSGAEPASTYNILTRIDDAGLFKVNPPVTFPLNNAPVDVLENDAFGNVTGGPLNSRYTIEPVSAKGCVGPRDVVTLKINPEPQLDPDLGKNLCSEEATSITLRAAVGSAVADRFVINSISTGGMTTVNPPPALNTQLPATAIFTDQWIYTGSTFGTVQYEIAPVNFATGCVGTPSSTLEVRIFPIPDLTLPGPVTICSGEGQNISLSVPNITTPTVTISSTVSFIDANISGAQSQITTGLSASIPEVLMNSSFVNPGIVQYSITAENRVSISKSCYSAPQILEVTVNPIPDANVLDPLQGCAAVLKPGIYNATLADIEPLITTGNTVTWYEQDPLVNPGATLISTPTYDFQDMVPVFAEVRNTFSCRQVVPVAYDVNNAVVLALAEENISCNGFQDGEIIANASAGSPPYFFQKNADPFVAAAGNSFTYSGLVSATYDITVRDSKGCLATVTSALIQEPTPLVFDNVDVKDVDCFFDASQEGTDRNGEIKITVSGSSGNYQYQLFPGPVTNNTGVFSSLRPGSYAIVVSDIGNSSCKLENSPVIIGVPERVEITNISIPVDSYGNEISCNGAQNGEVHITARGGAGKYFVTLTPFNPQDPKRAVSNVPVVFDGLAAGFYKISVQDTIGCKAPNASVTIRDIPQLTPGKIGIDQNVCFNQDDGAGDVDEFIELVSPFGGSGPYEYIWQQSTQSSPAGQWFDIAGATTTTYDPDPLGGGVNSPYTQPGDYFYRRLIRNTPPAISLNNRPSFCDDYKGQDDIVTVTVQPAPAVSVVGDGIACQGDDKFYQLRLDNGSAPMTFTWDDGNFTYNNQTANLLSAPYKVSDIQQTLTVGFSNIKDAYGCIAPDATIQIDVTTISADFEIDPTSGCTGDAFAFTHDVNNLLDYTWNFGDGSQDLIRPAGTSTGSETYTYDPAITAQGDAKFFVTFKAQEQGGGCFKIETKELTVFRALNLSLSNPPPAICVGESFKLTDKSIGVTTGVYYYADVNGNNRGPDIQGPLPEITFTLPEPPNNGDEYYVYYDAQNSNDCPAQQIVGPVRVYNSVTADFTINPNPAKMIAGQVEVDFKNNSVPLDNTIFEYRWDYPIVDVVSVTDPNPYDKHVIFSSEKEQEVTLTVFNMARPECRSTHLEVLKIDLEGALADFLVTRAGCTPLHVTTKNLSVSFDIFEWQLTSTVGVNETSQLTEPQFDLNQPGTYYLVLKASKAGNSIAPMITPPKAIEVLARPRADFFFRTNEVYVGSQLKPVNETVNACDGCWNWDFGDGFTYNNIFEPTHTYSLEGKYPVTLEAWFDHGNRDVDDDGVLDGNIVCNDIEEKEIRVIEGGKIKIPNAFTPNVNGSNGGNPDNNFTNDVFLPIMDGVEEFTMQIFDRWGNLIFQSKEKNVGWDGYDEKGRLMPAGVYVYKVVLRLGDGERTTKVGDVTLIR